MFEGPIGQDDDPLLIVEPNIHSGNLSFESSSVVHQHQYNNQQQEQHQPSFPHANDYDYNYNQTNGIQQQQQPPQQFNGDYNSQYSPVINNGYTTEQQPQQLQNNGIQQPLPQQQYNGDYNSQYSPVINNMHTTEQQPQQLQFNANTAYSSNTNPPTSYSEFDIPKPANSSSIGGGDDNHDGGDTNPSTNHHIEDDDNDVTPKPNQPRFIPIRVPGGISHRMMSIILWPYLHWPSLIILLVLGLSGFLTQKYVRLGIAGDISIDISASSFQIKNHPASEQYDGYVAARNYCSGQKCSKSCQRDDAENEKLATNNRYSRNRRNGGGEVKFYYKSDTNVLSQSNLLWARSIERDFKQFSADHPQSIIFDTPGTCAPNDVLCTIHHYDPYQWVGGDDVQLNGTVWKAQIFLSIFSNVPDIFSSSELVAKLDYYNQHKAEFCRDGCVLSEVNAEFIYRADNLYDYIIMEYVEHDLMFCIYAGAVVALYLFVHTMSLWLTLVGVFNIVLSFPLSYFLYRDCLGNTQALPLLAIASIFITIGIAVDDVFVFVDTFKQSNTADSLSDRLRHTITRAGKATLFTSLTSAVAFASNALSDIPALHDFGVFTALVVVANYLLVLTLTLAGISFWHRWIAPIGKFCARKLPCLKRGQASIAGQNRQMYQNQAFRQNRRASLVSNDSHQLLFANADDDDDDIPMMNFSDATSSEGVDSATNNSHTTASHQQQLSFMQLVLLKTVVPVVRRGRIVLVVMAVALVAGGVYLGATIPISTSLPSFAPPESNLGRAQDLATEFPQGAGYTPPKLFTSKPTPSPTTRPPNLPSLRPTQRPTRRPPTTQRPTQRPTKRPTPRSTQRPTTQRPSNGPVQPSTNPPTSRPTTSRPNSNPQAPPTSKPTSSPTRVSPNPNPTTSPTTVTIAPRTINDYPNQKVRIVFGISDPFVDRIGLSTKSVEIDETLWRPHFDDKFGVQFPCSANDPKLRQIQQICQELANDDTLILQVGDQENICSDANILSACQGHPGASIQAGFTTKCFATTFSWIAFGDFVSSEPTAESPFEIYDVWSKWDTKMKNMVLKYPQVSSAFAVSSSWSSSVYTVLAVKGSIWSIAVSYLLSFVAVYLHDGRSLNHNHDALHPGQRCAGGWRLPRPWLVSRRC